MLRTPGWDWVSLSLLLGALSPAAASGAGSAIAPICALTFHNPKTNSTWACSGTLISKDIVVTAAHCFEGLPKDLPQKASVGCGYQGKVGNQFSFLESFTSVDVKLGGSRSKRDSGTDLALVRLNHPATSILPMKRPESLQAFQQDFMRASTTSSGDMELKPSVECRFAGFGIPWDAETSERTFLTADQSPANGLKVLQNSGSDFSSILVILSWGDGIEQMRKGDSGGPFFCRKDSESEWLLAGVVSNGTVDPRLHVPMGINQLASTTSLEFADLLAMSTKAWSPPAPKTELTMTQRLDRIPASAPTK